MVKKKSRSKKCVRKPEVPELMYFDGPGRANLTRLAFAAGGVAFRDTRVADWPSLKADLSSVPSQMFGQLPVIKHGLVQVAQSLATATYAADLGIWQDGRLGKDCQVAANRATDIMLAATNEDLRGVMYKCMFGDDASKEAGKAALPAAAAKLLSALEQIHSRRTTPGPFFFSQAGPSLADLAVFDNVTSTFPGLQALGIDLTPYPGLMGVVDAVAKDPRIDAYLNPQKLTLYTNPICPFAHRAWMCMVEKGLKFETVLIPLSGELAKFQETGKTANGFVDKTVEECLQIKEDYKRDINDTGEVPSLACGTHIVTESDVVAEFLQDAFPDSGSTLLPACPAQRARVRSAFKALSGGNGVMAFYGLLTNQDASKDEEYRARIEKFHAKFVELADAEGPWFLGQDISFMDIMLAPFYLRFSVLLRHYRATEFIPSDDKHAWAARMRQWAKAMDARPSFQATRGQTDEEFITFYGPYAGERRVVAK